MRFFTCLQAMSFPCAELLLVTGLFWAVICGNVVTDVMEPVLFRGRSLSQGWDIMERRFEAPAYLADPDTNLSIFFNPVGIKERNDTPAEHLSAVVEALRLPADLCEGRSVDLEDGTIVAESGIPARIALGED